MVSPSGCNAFHVYENIFNGSNHQEISHLEGVPYSLNSERLDTKA